jgi:hypothetical protein
MDGITITALTPVNPGDSRGPTYECWKGLEGRQVSVYVRRQGVRFGMHYHTGSDPSKAPERFFLVTGKVKLTAENPEGERLETIIEAGTALEIGPMVKHAMEALTNVAFIEYRRTPFDRDAPDTFPTSI